MSDRVRLGHAILDRADEVCRAVLTRIWPDGTAEVDAHVVRTIAETDRAGILILGRWLTGGALIDEAERRSLTPLAFVDRVGLEVLIKAYLAWPAVMLDVLEDEAARLGSPPELVDEVRMAVSSNNNGSMVRMARRYEQERRELLDELDSEKVKLAQQALHDALTGLPNRVLLFDRLEHALRVSARSGNPLAVLFIDLDGFKAVNDRLGHHVGDELLVAVAARINETVRGSDTTARLGGDEFVVLCQSVTDAAIPAQAAQRIVVELGRPFALSCGDVTISASVGIAGAFGLVTAGELLVRADDAMYAAKEQGGGRFELEQQSLV